MEGKLKKVKSKAFEELGYDTAGFNFSKSIKLQAGEYVWCANAGSPFMVGKLVTIENAPEHVKKSSRSNTILIQFVHDDSYQNIPVPNIISFKEDFVENSDNYIRKIENAPLILEKIAKEIRWGEGVRIIQDLITKQHQTLPLKRARLNYPCELCGKISGPQIFCFECGRSSVHKKKCAGLTSDEWVCKNCSKTEATLPSPTLPELSRASSMFQEFSAQSSIERVVEEAKKDQYLYNNLLKRQQKYAEINAELIKRNESLITIQKAEEVRRKRYENDEFIRKETDELIMDLISQLHCARIPGFETTKKLIEMYGNDVQTLDRYKVTQKEIVLGLLKYQLPSHDKRPQQDCSTSKFERFLDKSNPNGIYSKLAVTLKKFNDLTVNDLVLSPSPGVVYSLAKLIIDGTLANCEYTPGQQIDHVGGGTNPESLKTLLRKVKDKYNIVD